MKKIFTLFFAMMAAVTLLAAPQTKLVPMGQAPATKLHPQALRLLTSDLSKRATPAALAVERKAPSHRLAPIAKTTAEAIDLYGEGFLVGPEYDAAASEWYIALEAGGYTFRLCWYGEADSYCGTYTYDDISWEWTWGWYQSPDMFFEIYPSDITMTISEQQVSECLKQITLEATIEDLNNDMVYELHAVHKMFSPKSTVETTIQNTQVTVGNGFYVLDGDNANMDIVLKVNSSVIEGEYTLANFDTKSTIVYGGVKQKMLEAKLLVYCDYLADGSLGYDATLSFYNQDTVLHIVSMPVPLPAAKDTIQVVCNNLSVDESLADYGYIMVSGASDDYDVFAMYEGTMAHEGVYENVAVSISDMRTWEMVSSISATLTLTEGVNGWEANIETYCSDYNWYSINMQFVIPTPTDTVQVTFDDSSIASFDPYAGNLLQLINYGSNFEVALTVVGVAPGESFGIDNVHMLYTDIYNSSAQSMVEIADVNGRLLQYGDTTMIAASIIGFDAVQYDVELWYTVPTPVDTVVLEMPVEFINAMDYGYYTLAAYSPDGSIYVSFSPLTSEVAGVFENDGVFGRFGAADGAYDFYGGNTFVYIEEEWKNYTVEQGTLVVELADDGSITAEAKVICSNAVYYHIKMTSEYNTHLDYDEPEEEVDRLYTTEDVVFIENQIEDNGYIYLSLTAADGSDMAAFFFFAEQADEDIIIPEGVYTIDASEDYGTVYANPGVQGDGVWPSYYALMADGGLVVPLWLLVDGTVEVTKDEDGNVFLEVNAQNSYGVNVHIVFDGTPINSAVENTQRPSHEANAQKILHNAQLHIISDRCVYNAQGARVK